MSEIEWKILTKNHQLNANNINEKNDESWSSDFYFVQGADPQLGMMDFFNKPNFNPETTSWDEEIRLATLAVQNVNKLRPKPRFFIVCGDHTNQFPGTLPGIKKRQIEDFKKIFSKVDPEIPLVCVCGNHDIGNTPTLENVNMYRADFGDDYFSFWCGGVLFLVLNSQFYKDASLVTELAAEQDCWLDEQLAAASGFPIVCFSHIPWFMRTVDEDDDIFNIPLKVRTFMLEKLYKAGVRYMFCGHTHQNAGGYYKDLEIVATSAIGMQIGSDKSGLRIVNVRKDRICHKYYDLENMPTENFL